MIVRLRLADSDTVHEYALTRQEALIGRSRRMDLCVNHPAIALRHAALRRKSGVIWLEPLRPEVILRVKRGDDAIETTEPIALRPGDLVHLGRGEGAATIELVAAQAIVEPARDVDVIGRIDDTPEDASLTWLHQLNRFALQAAVADDPNTLRQMLTGLLTGLLGEPPACALVILGRRERPPEVVGDVGLQRELSRRGLLMVSLDCRRDLVERLNAGQLLRFPLEENTLFVVPTLFVDKSESGYWAFTSAQTAAPQVLKALGSSTSRLVGAALERLAQARDLRAARAESHYFRDRERRHYLYKALVTKSPAMRRVYDEVSQLVELAAPVLIVGEKGSGKEMIVRALHHLSPRASSLLVRQGCETSSEAQLDAELFGRRLDPMPAPGDGPTAGLLELSRGGTLFLETIDRLPLRLQIKLSRAITEGEVRPEGECIGRPVDVRIVASSETPLAPLVKQGTFRKQLQIQFADRTISLPPLRARREDIIPLAEVFISQLAPRYRKRLRLLDPDLGARLAELPWHGNVRELQAYIEAAVISSPDDAEILDHVPWLT